MGKDRAARILAEIVKSLWQLRKQQGISHEALAQKAGVSRPAISQIESGKRRPSLMVSLRIAHALGVDLSDLLKPIEENQR